MGIIAWIVLGLIAGGLAKLIMPGRDPGGIIVTMLIGIAGAIIGGCVFSPFRGGGGTRGDLGSTIRCVGCALILLAPFPLVSGPLRRHFSYPPPDQDSHQNPG